MDVNEEKSPAKKAGSILDLKELPEQEYDCPKHGKYTGMPVKMAFLEKVIDPPCPKCAEEEAAAKAAEYEHREQEEREQRRINYFKRLNIGRIFWDESFETFDAYTDELKNHLEICVDFANDPKGRKLVMLGNHGNGKNHLAASILKVTGGIIHKIYEIELMLHQSYSGETQEYKVLQELCETEMLVIDEIGRTKPSNWEMNWLSYVIDKRHENFMPLVLISNKHLKEDCPEGESGCLDCIQNFVGNDILSRIIENGVILEFTGDDYRYKKRMKNLEGHNA